MKGGGGSQVWKLCFFAPSGGGGGGGGAGGGGVGGGGGGGLVCWGAVCFCWTRVAVGGGGGGSQAWKLIFLYPFHETLITQKKKKKIMTVAISMILLNS